jgi:uncharacterized protein (TIGR02300 family)
MAIIAKKDPAPAAALMAATPLGLKRICATCSVVYYDAHRRPPVCPSCGAAYVVPTGGRATARAARVQEEDNADDPLAAVKDVDVEDDDDLAEADDVKAVESEADILPDDGDDDGDDGLGLGIHIEDDKDADRS